MVNYSMIKSKEFVKFESKFQGVNMVDIILLITFTTA